jgi:hypothetical protein
VELKTGVKFEQLHFLLPYVFAFFLISPCFFPILNFHVENIIDSTHLPYRFDPPLFGKDIFFLGKNWE